jgi:hypothetical protein
VKFNPISQLMSFGLGKGGVKQLTSALYLTNKVEWILILGMLIILFLPLLGRILRWPKELDLQENRHLSQPPDFRETAWNDLPHGVDQWWNDRFAFRTQLIPLKEFIWYDLLKVPGKQLVPGLDGHVFFNSMPGDIYQGAQNSTVLDYMGINQLTAEQLSNWTDYLEGKSAWLRVNGIHYLFVIAPNKVTVEERFLPNKIRMAKGKSYLEQLREDVFPKLTQNVDLLDLIPVMIAKEHETGIPMFNRAGDVTHWNEAGFYEGLVAMDNHLRSSFPSMAPFPKDKIELRVSDNDRTVFSCHWKEDISVHAAEEKIVSFRSGNWTDSKCSTADGRNGNLVLFSDSSWKALFKGLNIFSPGGHTAFPYQWEKHRHAHYGLVTFNELQRIVREERPNVIVEAQTERALTIPAMGIPPEFRDAARFARGKPVFSWSADESDTMSDAVREEIEVKEDTFVVNITKENPVSDSLNFIRAPQNSTSVLLIDVEVPAAGTFQLFWSLKKGFCENGPIKEQLEAGRNVKFFPIPIPTGEELRLCVHPGTVTGRYQIRKIEIRATPAQL